MSEKVQTPEQVQTQVDKFTDGIKASLGKNPTKPFKFNEFWARSLQMQRLVVAGTPVLHQEDMGNLYSALGKNQVVWDGVVEEVRKAVKHSRERGNPSDLTRKVRAALDIAVALGMNQPSDDPKLKATGEFVRLMIGKYGVGDMSPEGVRIDEPGSDRGRNRLWSWIGRAVHRKKESAGEQILAARQLKPKSWVEVEKDGQVKGEWTAFDVNSGLDGFEVTEVGSEWKICYQGADKPVKKGSHLRLGKTDKEEAQRRIAAGENPDKVISEFAQKYSQITDWDQLTATAATPTAVPEAVDQSHLGGGSEATPNVSDPDVGGPPVEQPAAAETNPDLSTPEKVEAWFKAREKLRKAPPSIIGDDQQLRAWDGAWSNACSASMSLKWLLKENIGPEGIIMYLFYGFKSVTKAAQKAGLDSNLDTTIQQISAKLGVHYEKAKKAWLADTDFSRLDQCLREVQRLIKSETTSAEEESIVPPFLAEARELFVQKIAEVIHNKEDLYRITNLIGYVSTYGPFASLVISRFAESFPEQYQQALVELSKIRQAEEVQRRKDEAEIGQEYEVNGKKYTIIRRLGGGKYGEVFLAHGFGGEKVAVKVANEGLDEEEDKAFHEESITLSFLRHYQLNHNLTVNGEELTPVYQGLGQSPSSRDFFVMTLAEGQPIDEIFRDNRRSGIVMPESDVLAIGVQLCQVFEALHGMGKVYLDFQPKNIFWDQDKHKITVVDWNLLAPLSPKGVREDLRVIAKTMGAFFGLDHRTLDSEEYSRAIEDSAVPLGLKPILTQALSHDPAQGYQNPQQLRQDLESLN